MAISTSKKQEFLIGMVISLSLIMNIVGVINLITAYGTLGLIQIGPVWSLVFLSFVAGGVFIAGTDYPTIIRTSAMLKTQVWILCLWLGFLALILLGPRIFVGWPPIPLEGLGVLIALVSPAHLAWSYSRSRELPADS
jgi:hypothetical protein